MRPVDKRPSIRNYLIKQGLVTNHDDYKWYDGSWANVMTRHLSSEQLQWFYWLYRQKTIGWWEPNPVQRKSWKLWTSFWIYGIRPVMQYFYERRLRKIGWEGLYKETVEELRKINLFDDL